MTSVKQIGFSGIHGTIKMKDGKTQKLEEIKPELKEQGSSLTVSHAAKAITEALKGYNSIESIKFTSVDNGSRVTLDDSALETPNIEFKNVDMANISLKGNSSAKITGTARESQISVSDSSKLDIENSLDSRIGQSGGELSIKYLSSNYPIPDYDKNHKIKPYVYKKPVDETTVKREGVDRVEAEIKKAKSEVEKDRDFAKGKLREYLSSYSTVVISGNSVANIENANNGTKINHCNENADLTITNLEKGSKLIAPARYSENHLDIKKLVNSLTDKAFNDSIRELCKMEARHSLKKLKEEEREELIDKMVNVRLTKFEDHKSVKKQKSEVSISQEEARIIVELNGLDSAEFADGMTESEAAEYRKNHVENNNGGEILSSSKYNYIRVGNLYDDERNNADNNYFDYRGKSDAVREDAYNLEPFTNKRDFKEKYGKNY